MVFRRVEMFDILQKLDPRLRGENPLEVIGLSHAVLGLRLSNEQLRQLCLRMARFLLAEFHEDRRGIDPAVVDAARRYSAALSALKDRQVFEAYLSLFRAQRSEEKSEVNEWRRAYQAIKEQADLKDAELHRLRAKLLRKGETIPEGLGTPRRRHGASRK